MRIVDQNGRLFGKISVIDVFALLVVVVMAVAVLNKPSSGVTVTPGASDSVIRFQILIQGAQDYIEDAVQVGDELYDMDHDSKGPLGQVVEIQITPGTRLADLNDGKQEFVPMEGGIDLLLTVEGHGVANEDGYALNSVYQLGVNAYRNFYSKYTQLTGTVVKISAQEEQT